jgi:pyruvate,orthophosphate dikinase
VVLLDGIAALLRDVLGDKGYRINLMRGHGLPVPPAFCLPTDICTEFFAGRTRCLDRI